MKLYVSSRAPNPRRVQMFIAEKGIEGIESIVLDLNTLEHKTEAFRRISPMARVPVLLLDDGRALSETRAICTYLEGLYPEPSLMGRTHTERAFIEMVDRHVELYFFFAVSNSVRHLHPGLAVLEQPQIAEYGRAQADKVREVALWMDGELTQKPYLAGEEFSIADITAFCALDFARGLMKFVPGQEGMPNLQAYFDRIKTRPSAKI